jgi:hypothetical protein
VRIWESMASGDEREQCITAFGYTSCPWRPLGAVWSLERCRTTRMAGGAPRPTWSGGVLIWTGMASGKEMFKRELPVPVFR